MDFLGKVSFIAFTWFAVLCLQHTAQRERNLGRGLQRKVRKYYQFYLDRKTAFDEATLLGDLTESLKTEAIMHLNRDIVGKIPFLKPVRGKGVAAGSHRSCLTCETCATHAASHGVRRG